MTINWNKPTPQVVKNIRDTINGLLAACLTGANLFVPMLHMSGENYAMWIGFIGTVVNVGAKTFGVSDKEAFANAAKANNLAVEIVEKREEDK